MFSRKMEGQGLISWSDGKRLISNSEASIEGTPHALEGAPIQYHATTVPQPFLYTAWPQQVPPWMGQQPRMIRFPANNLNSVKTTQRTPHQQCWSSQRRRTMN